MTLILDYAWARPTPASIKAAGYGGAMRYLSPDASKNLSKAEAAALLAAGLSIGLVWESFAARAGQGFAAGAADAVSAEAQADALGYPTSAVLFFAVDYDAAPSAVAPYFAGVVSKAHHPVGVYGSARVVEGVNVPYKWQACAWSRGRVSASAHLYQRLHATVAHPLPGTDENAVLHDFPMWTNIPTHVNTGPSRGTTRTPLPGRDTAMVMAIQKALHVTADGMWGDGTSAAANAVILHRGDVRALQGYVGTKVDGAFGPASQAAWVATIRNLQAAIGANPDGDWGPLSQAAWNRAYDNNYKKWVTP